MRRCAPVHTLILVLTLPLLSGELEGQIPQGMEGVFEPHPEASEAISRLYSPFCPGFMLEVCTAQASIALRDSIQVLAYQGWSSSELVDWMLGNHGEQYRAVPERWGWGVWAWLLPPLGLLIGLGLVVLALRRFRPPESETGLTPHPGTEVVLSEMDEERLRSAIRELELSEDPSF